MGVDFQVFRLQIITGLSQLHISRRSFSEMSEMLGSLWCPPYDILLCSKLFIHMDWGFQPDTEPISFSSLNVTRMSNHGASFETSTLHSLFPKPH